MDNRNYETTGFAQADLSEFITPDRATRRKNARDHAKQAIKDKVLLQQGLRKLTEHAKELARTIDKKDDEINELKIILREMMKEFAQFSCKQPDAPGHDCGECLTCEARIAVQSMENENVPESD